jgi:hypothetical protein
MLRGSAASQRERHQHCACLNRSVKTQSIEKKAGDERGGQAAKCHARRHPPNEPLLEPQVQQVEVVNKEECHQPERQEQTGGPVDPKISDETWHEVGVVRE